ncbi:hypothetical protein [Actinomyces gaoshouyii]|uniref:hypothetical protein n=1 Tax=Actinomyces gaoshouyii TaxID=1960083 RepID=UPI0009BDD470|nr:hypothetical protein [Actinomyces gaoshouyii]ARD42489.1 hypothetical protein B6G06_09175 [Actinomyces gaoshouyii]
MSPTFPTLLYEDDDLTVCGVLLAPDTDAAQNDVITADIPSYLDQWEDDRIDPDQAPVPTTWFIRRGLWVWEDDLNVPGIRGRQILVPADPEQDSAFPAVLLDRYDPWHKVCAHHPGLQADTGILNPTTPNGYPYTYLCRDCASRHRAQRDAWNETFLRPLGAGLPYGVITGLLEAGPTGRLVPDEADGLSTEDLNALPIGAHISCRGSTWERVPYDVRIPGGMWDDAQGCVTGQQLAQDGPVHLLVTYREGAS